VGFILRETERHKINLPTSSIAVVKSADAASFPFFQELTKQMDVPPILIIGDEAEVITGISRVLNRSGYAVESFSNGMEALDKFKSAQFSLVIADEKLPEMSGLEVLDALKKMSPQIPVIMLSSDGTVNDAVEAMQQGAADYLLKPIPFDVLAKTVQKIFRGANGNGRFSAGSNPDLTLPSAKEIITQNQALQSILALARNIAASNATVLIQGESGTGKELLAAYIHRHSCQPQAPYVAVNCAALPDTLAESELFGHEKGAFTGAVSRKIGKFELAKQGTVVLDEISEMPLQLQAKLLRVLQEREIDRIGGMHPIRVHARVVAITNVNLKKAVSEGKFREDLYYRINVIPLRLPPLRERKDDIPLLAKYFLKKTSVANKKNVAAISDEAMTLLLKHDWKGNIRELENCIERAVLVGNAGVILPEHLILDSIPGAGSSRKELAVDVGVTVKEMEKELIVRTLKEVDDNRTRAAELLGISIRTLRNKLQEYKQDAHQDGI
jgi:DNA-binding NtrC family response regulator